MHVIAIIIFLCEGGRSRRWAADIKHIILFPWHFQADI